MKMTRLDKTYSYASFTYKVFALLIIVHSRWFLFFRLLHSPVVIIIIEDTWMKLYGTRDNPFTGERMGYSYRGRPRRRGASDYLFGNPHQFFYDKRRMQREHTTYPQRKPTQYPRRVQQQPGEAAAGVGRICPSYGYGMTPEDAERLKFERMLQMNSCMGKS